MAERQAWSILRDGQGEEIGADVVLDDLRFLTFRVTENPETEVRYVQMRLWARPDGASPYKLVYGDAGLTLGPDLAQSYAPKMVEIGEAIAELLPLVMAGAAPSRKAAGASNGPRARTATPAPAAPARAAARRF